MKNLKLHILRIITIIIVMVSGASRYTSAATSDIDSLLKVLDNVIDNREMYLTAKEKQIIALKNELPALRSEREVYAKNSEIIDQYESFVCDSAKTYLHRNFAIAERLRDSELMAETSIRLALVYAMSGQFVQARDIFRSLDYDSYPDHIKARYGWAQLKYLENMMISTDEPALREEYHRERIAWRDSLINMFDVNSDLYRKEIAGRCQEMGNYKGALTIYLDVFHAEKPDTHGYAMVSKGLADLYDQLGDEEQHKRFLLLSSITDIRLAVKENESLMALAEMLYAEGEVDRAYRYMRVALEDANFYNSRFKNALIARIYPIVEVSYMEMLGEQQRRMRVMLFGMAMLAIVMVVVALLLFKQTRALSRSRAEISKVNNRLERASVKLAEANLIREQYVGYFMHQCSLNLDKLDKFRLNVNRKLKANQVEDAFVMTSRPLGKELDELYDNFDKAFLNLYPNYIEEFNNLLQPEARFTLPKDHLNTSIRIFALIRLGINDMAQIANFLHYSVQTVYNYKSKVRKTSVLSPEEFEEKVKKIGTLAQKDRT